MVIGFDAKRAFSNFTGLGNYSRYVIKNLSVFFPDNQYRLYSPSEGKSTEMQALLKQDNLSVILPDGLYRHFSSFWRTKGIGKRLKNDHIDLYHGLSNEIPVGLRSKGVRSVVTIHDLIFLRYPRFYKAADRAIYTRKFGYACRNADHIIAVSECTKRDIISYFDINPEKISVVYQGCNTSFMDQCPLSVKSDVRARYQLPGTYILNVGTIEYRKNLLLAVKALSGMDDSVHLVAIGRQTPYADEVNKYIRSHGLENRVRFLSGVPLSDLPALYQMASVFVYPSFFEGFGIPVIEALHSGVPVVAATGSCLEEAGGPGSAYVDPMDDTGLADRISAILTDTALKERMISGGREYVKRFDDQKLTVRMMDVYKRIVPGSRP